MPLGFVKDKPSRMIMLIRFIAITLICTVPFAVAGCGTPAHQGSLAYRDRVGGGLSVGTEGGSTSSTPTHTPTSTVSSHGGRPHGSSQSGDQRGTKRPGGSGSTKPAAVSNTPRTMPDATGPFQDLGGRGAKTGATNAKPSGSHPSTRTTLQDVVKESHLKPTEDQILAPFVAKLESLQSQYIGEVYGLYGQAKSEYHAGNASKTEIENKYIPKVLNLENSAQDQLNGLLFSLKAKLAAQGYPTTEVDVLRNAYYAEVAQMQGELKG